MDTDVLRQAPLFSSLDDEAATALGNSMAETTLRRGDVLFHEGDSGERCAEPFVFRHNPKDTILEMPMAAVALREVSLDDKYALESGRVYLTGVQALVRLLMLQRQRDKLAGLDTGGFVSGYRGSPLGGLDQALWKAAKFLERANVKFQPGLNEDLAATALLTLCLTIPRSISPPQARAPRPAQPERWRAGKASP